MPPYAALSFHKDDIIRFLNFPFSLTRDLEATITAAWAPGIQTDTPETGSHTYKLKGKPWAAKGDPSEVASRRLLRDILAYLYARDWLLVTSLGHSVRLGSKDTLLFKNIPLAPPDYTPAPASPTAVSPVSSVSPGRISFAPPPTVAPAASAASSIPPSPARAGAKWLAVTITKSDILRIDCANEGLAMRAINSARGVLDREDALTSADWNNDAFEFKLRDKPWNAHGDSGWQKPRLLLLGLVESLEGLGWRSYGAIMHRNEEGDDKKADSWFFVMRGDGGQLVPPNPHDHQAVYEMA